MIRLLIFGTIYVISGLIPLWTQVGQNFEYEYALLASWCALLLIPLSAIVLPERWLGLENSEFTPSKTIEVYWILFISPLIVPLIALWHFARQLCQCSYTGYLFWMVVLWYPAWISAHGLHHLFLKARCLGKRRGQLLAALSTMYFLIIVEVAITLWFNPQKRIVNQFAGFLHGPIYDTWIPVDSGLIWARTANLFGGILLLCAAWWRKSWLNVALTALTLGAWVSFGLLTHDYGSLSTGKNALNRLLSGTRNHEKFTLHYQKKFDAQAVEITPNVDILRVERASQFHINELSKIFKEENFSPIDIYVYPSQNEKKLWFGGGATDVTDVHTPSLHITAGGWNHPTLRHELVHALASNFGFYGLGFHPNMAFTEGLAVALAPEEDPISLDDGAASIIDNKGISNIENLFSPFFWKESGERAYTIAGSLIRFLIEKYGIDGVKIKYSGGSWKTAFSKEKAEILTAWQTKVTSNFDRKTFGMYAETLYRNPGLFRSICPHSRADLRQSRTDNPFARLRQPIGWMPEDNYQPWIEKVDPGDLGVRLAGWKKKIDLVVNDSAKHEAKIQTWEDVLNRARNRPPKVLEDVEIAILESDLLRVAGQKDKSFEILKELTEFGKSTFLGDSLTREIYTRINLEDLGPSDALKWRMYLAGWHPGAPSKANPSDPWLIKYLRLRRMDSESFDAESLDRLLMTELNPDLPKTFQVEWYRFLAFRFLGLENYKSAEIAWNHAADATSGPKRETYQMHAREAAFFAQTGPLKTTP
jgi:hypothetical protein